MKADPIVIAPKTVTVIAIHIEPNFFKIRLAGTSAMEYYADVSLLVADEAN